MTCWLSRALRQASATREPGRPFKDVVCSLLLTTNNSSRPYCFGNLMTACVQRRKPVALGAGLVATLLAAAPASS